MFGITVGKISLLGYILGSGCACKMFFMVVVVVLKATASFGSFVIVLTVLWEYEIMAQLFLGLNYYPFCCGGLLHFLFDSWDLSFLLFWWASLFIV
jgi:hypothetical protein